MSRKLMLLLMLGVCLTLPLQAQDAAPSGELVIALANDPTSLFVPRAADPTANNAAHPLYDSLISLDANNVILPQLAASLEISADGTEYTFNLRQDVSFHNGEAFDAQSVLATWETGKDPSNEYADVYAAVTNVEIIDRFTVKMTTNGANPTFIAELSGTWAMIPPVYMAEVGIEGFEQAPVGTGPFKFVERIAGERIVYDANLDYWQPGQPKVARVIFRIIPDPAARLAAIQSGELDIANRLSIDAVATLEGNANIRILTYPNDSVYYVAFKNIGNGIGTPLADVRVRQALNLAVNRQGIIDTIFGGEASLISGFIVQTNLGYTDAMQPYAYNPEQAKALLAEAGYTAGFAISMGCPTDVYLNINAVCLAIQTDLRAVGVEVTVDFKDSNTYWSLAQYGAVGPMLVDSWQSAVGEALPRLQGALLPGNFYNAWEDETITALINQIAVTVDRDERAALYGEIQAYMFETAPFIYLYQLNVFEAINVKVTGYVPRPAEDYDLRQVAITE
ncbi:MAG: ABC transporter substrate-binding protein [Armatimonadetes bacterium]|nr:ABC transporter substrate-binding protein [Anaerolineae bacterium]